MDIATGIGLAKTTAEVVKKLYEYSKTLKTQAKRQQMEEILTEVRGLSQEAWELEQTNRELSEKVRFSTISLINKFCRFHTQSAEARFCYSRGHADATARRSPFPRRHS